MFSICCAYWRVVIWGKKRIVCSSYCFPLVGVKLVTHHFDVPLVSLYFPIALCCWNFLCTFILPLPFLGLSSGNLPIKIGLSYLYSFNNSHLWFFEIWNKNVYSNICKLYKRCALLGALVRDLRRSCAQDRAFVNFGLLFNNYLNYLPFSVKLISY